MFAEIDRNPPGQHHRHRRALAEVAHAHGVPLIVDNTVPSPYLCRPFEHGADIVVHSLTKYLGGHGNHRRRHRRQRQVPVGAQGPLPRLNEPDVSYHGVVYTEALGAAAYIGRARASCRCATPARRSAPFNAFQILQGIETLALRMDRICDNTLAVAGSIPAGAPKVAITTPACPTTRPRPGAALMGGRASGLPTFGVKRRRAAWRRAFQDRAAAVHALVNIGDYQASLATHPATPRTASSSPEE